MGFRIAAIFYSFMSVVLSQNIIVNNETITEIPVENIVPANNYSYLAILNVTLVEEYLGEILLDLYNSSDTPLLLKDLFDLASLENLTVNKTCEILKNQNISFSIDSLEHTLNFLNIPFTTLWHNCINKLELNSTSQQSFITNFGVSPAKFSYALTFLPDTIYEVLKKGNYSTETFKSSLEILEKNSSDAFNILRDGLLEKFNKSLEISKETFTVLKNDYLSLWKEFNISASDVYRVRNFEAKLDEFMEILNQQPILGVFTDNTQLAIHQNLYSFISNHKRAIQMKVNDMNVFYIGTMGNKIVELKSEGNLSGFIPIGNGTPRTCRVLSLVNDTLDTTLIEIISINNDFIITQSDPVIDYLEGGPLICEDQLYGLVGSRNESVVIFDTFSKLPTPSLIELIVQAIVSISLLAISVLSQCRI